MEDMERLPERLTDQCADAGSLPALAGWKPIETAPKDGRDILVCQGKTVEIAHWHTGVGPEGWLGDDGASHHDYWNYVGLTKPTHWMAIPAPPVEGA